MKITLTETGGWTNISKRCVIDTLELPRETARVLEAALEQDALFAEHPAAPHARDARTVVIEVEGHNGPRRVTFSEAATPAGARIVLQILRPLSKVVAAGV